MKTKSVRPFGFRDELGYVFGDMAGSFVNLFVDAYFLTFCTYVLGISPAWMAGLFLVARLWDAINDPIMGSFPDRWHLGKTADKFKPWIKLFMIPLALSGVLCFSHVPFEGILLHAWVAFAYIFYGMSYTGTSMPFGAMASVVSADPIHRSRLSRARSIGGTVVGIGALSFVPVICFDADSNIIPERFTLLAVIFGVLSILCYTAIYILAMIGQTAFTMLIWALVTDCLDYSEWKLNIRSDGSMYSLYTFSRKIGSTIASTGAASALAAIGYVSGTNVVQTAATVNNIY